MPYSIMYSSDAPLNINRLSYYATLTIKTYFLSLNFIFILYILKYGSISWKNLPLIKTLQRRELWIIFAGYLVAMHVGKLSPVLPILQKQFHLSLFQAGLALSLVQAAGMLFALCIGVFSDRIGLKKCLITGLCLTGFASCSGLLIDNIYILFFFRFIEGMGFLFVTLSAPAILKRICDPQTLNLKMGIWSSYMGLGVGLAMLTIPLLLKLLSWQYIWFCLGSLSFILAWIITRQVQLNQTQATHAPSTPFLSTLKLTLKHPPILCLAVIFACYTSQWLTLVGFLPSIYLSNHITLESAGLLTALVAIANVVGTVVAGLLLHRGLTPKQLMSFGFCCMCIFSWLTLSQLHLPFAIQYSSILLFSLLGGFIPTTVFAISLHYAPAPHATAASVGLVLQISAAGQFLIPPLSGLLVSHTQNWSTIAWITTLLCCIGLCVVQLLFLRHPYRALQSS